MKRRLFNTVVATAGLAALALVLTEGAASAATWTPDGQTTSGSFEYAMSGRIAHVPGNAHSGVVLQPSGDGDSALLSDWNCPRAVTPPTLPAAPTTCTLLRALTVYEGSSTVFPSVDRGMRVVHAVSQHTDIADYTTGEVVDLTVNSNYTMFGSGPIATVVYNTQPGYQEIDRTRAFTRVTGHFGWINFNDPRVKISAGSVTGSFFFVQSS